MSKLVSVELDIAFDEAGDFPKLVKHFAQTYGVKHKVVTTAGPAGWPVVKFTGTLNRIHKLLADYGI